VSTLRRVQSILSIAISAVVIVLSTILVIFVWIVQDDLSSSVVAVLTELDNVFQIIRDSVSWIEPEILTLGQLTSEVETATIQIAQNLSDGGIILRQLPKETVADLTEKNQSLQINFVSFYDLLEAVSDVLLAVDQAPFIDFPGKSLSTISTLKSGMEQISDQIDLLETNLTDLRQESGVRMSKISDSAAFLGEEIENFRTDLIEIDRDLEKIQEKVHRYELVTPRLIITSAIFISLFAGWIVYSQIRLIFYQESQNYKGNEDAGEKAPSPIDEEF